MKASHLPPQRKSEIWAGTRLPIDLLLEPPQELVVDCWVESSSGIVRQCQVVPAGSPLEGFADRLASAINRPLSGMRRYRPGGILVDRPELAEAIGELCAENRIEIQIRPEVADKLQELVSKLERDLGGGAGFGYMQGEEVEPGLVSELFERTGRVLDRRPWYLVPFPLMLEVSGLLHKPVYVSVLGDGSDVELVLHMSPKEAHEFSSNRDGRDNVPGLHLTLFPPGTARPGLKAEMEEHGWREHALGVPLLLSGYRPERSNPTGLELKVMNLVLQALEAFNSEGEVQTLVLNQGTEVTLRLVPLVDPEILEGRSMEPGDVIETLDKLWAEGDLDEAIRIAVMFLSKPGNHDGNPVMYRLPLYLCGKGDLEWANRYWHVHSHGCAAEWHYLGAFIDLRRGHASSAAKRLKKGVKHDLEVGRRLLKQDGEGDYTRLWSPMWQSQPRALEMLTGALADEKPAKRSSKRKK